MVFLIKQMVGLDQKARVSHQRLSQGTQFTAENWESPSVGSGARTGVWPGVLKDWEEVHSVGQATAASTWVQTRWDCHSLSTVPRCWLPGKQGSC